MAFDWFKRAPKPTKPFHQVAAEMPDHQVLSFLQAIHNFGPAPTVAELAEKLGVTNSEIGDMGSKLCALELVTSKAPFVDGKYTPVVYTLTEGGKARLALTVNKSEKPAEAEPGFGDRHNEAFA